MNTDTMQPCVNAATCDGRKNVIDGRCPVDGCPGRTPKQPEAEQTRGFKVGDVVTTLAGSNGGFVISRLDGDYAGFSHFVRGDGYVRENSDGGIVAELYPASPAVVAAWRKWQEEQKSGSAPFKVGDWVKFRNIPLSPRNLIEVGAILSRDGKWFWKGIMGGEFPCPDAVRVSVELRELPDRTGEEAK
jgi:hypothetical protein